MPARAPTPEKPMIEIPSPEQVALARRLYLGKIPVKAILAEAGIKLHTLYRCLAGDFPDGSRIAPTRIALGLLART